MLVHGIDTSAIHWVDKFSFVSDKMCEAWQNCFVPFYPIIFVEVLTLSFKTGPENFGGLVLKNLNLLGPLAH